MGLTICVYSTDRFHHTQILLVNRVELSSEVQRFFYCTAWYPSLIKSPVCELSDPAVCLTAKSFPILAALRFFCSASRVVVITTC